MDTLDNTDWDVVISGTGIKQSLLALSLSRSGLKILHLDERSFYGGQEAALSLNEVQTWAEQHSRSSGIFTDAVIEKHGELGASRAYSLALAPQLIFARSNLIPALVSSRVDTQLEFQAVGSWFVQQDGLIKVPSGREDIFQDTTLDHKTKRALMKFIRSISVEELELDDSTMPTYLERSGIPATAHAPILALALSPVAADKTESRIAIPNVLRHLQSIGHYGPGFGSLTPKYGGLAEIAQVACRACAVGGGVYVLGRDYEVIEHAETIRLKLGEDSVKTKWLVSESKSSISTVWSKGIYIISSPLSELFPPTSEGGVTPAGAVLMVPGDPPVYILAHSADTAECPSGQCILYASVQLPRAYERLREAVNAYPVAWSLHYQQSVTLVEPAQKNHITVGNSPGLAVEDTMLDEVRQAWQRITGLSNDEFMKFEAREDEDSQ